MNEKLDFCRVKKIDEKGYGFLKSLHFYGDIFFHFSQIRKEDFRDKLNNMKRGDFIIYFTSKEQLNGKRKADKIWYSLKEVPAEFIPEFTTRIINEFNTGNLNLYDLLFAFDELRQLGTLSAEHTDEILNSQKVKTLPSTILPYLNKDEIKRLAVFLSCDSLKEKSVKPFWYDDLFKAVEEAG